MGKPSGPKPQRLPVGLSPVSFNIPFFGEKMSNKKNAGKNRGALRHIIIIFLGTFFCATLVSLATTSVTENITAVSLIFIVLFVVIAIGVLFDAIGVASMSADVVPVNARSSRKAPGAVCTLKLLRKANVVANVCCDVIGDICGIVSGALGATLVLMIGNSVMNYLLLSALMSGMVSALTVGGKAVMKGVAINNADAIMEAVGKLLDYKNWGVLLSGKKRQEDD